jgi:hypothetical protein
MEELPVLTMEELKAQNEELLQRVAQLEELQEQAAADALPVTEGDCDAAATDAAFQFYAGALEKQTFRTTMRKVARQFQINQVVNAMGYVQADQQQMRDLGSKQGDVVNAWTDKIPLTTIASWSCTAAPLPTPNCLRFPRTRKLSCRFR